jgi:uncharacterized protein involved in response to NO
MAEEVPMPRCRTLSQPYDNGLSAMLITYIATGLVFMLLPGTFVGAMNLLKISAAHASSPADAAWIQAHGHAQIFGWLGTFIFGVGFYTIPRLRLTRHIPAAAWTTYALWISGVSLRWAVGSWSWNWRTLLPLAAVLELAASIVFFLAMFTTKPRTIDTAWRATIRMIGAASLGIVATMAVHAVECFRVAAHGTGPVFPFEFNQRYLVLITWASIVPFIWGFATRWIPPLFGLRATRRNVVVAAFVVLFSGCFVAMTGSLAIASAMLLVASLLYVAGMRLAEPAAKEAKLKGIHPTTHLFLRVAHGWLVIAAVLGVVATQFPMPNGFAGAGRHALTVGFFSLMVFCIGPRVLPAFFGVVRLYSARLMFASLVLLDIGCTIRVTSQILAYQHISALAWKWLPLSAMLEMVAMTLFAANMLLTLRTGSPLDTFYEAQRQAVTES